MWNYRVIKKKDEYGLYEVFYNDSGDICAHAEKPEVIGETIDELRRSLQLMTLDLEKSKDAVLDWGKIKFSNWEDDLENDKDAYLETRAKTLYEFNDDARINWSKQFAEECPPGMIKVPKLDEGDCDCIPDLPPTPIPQEVDFDGTRIMMSDPPKDKKT